MKTLRPLWDNITPLLFSVIQLYKAFSWLILYSISFTLNIVGLIISTLSLETPSTCKYKCSKNFADPHFGGHISFIKNLKPSLGKQRQNEYPPTLCHYSSPSDFSEGQKMTLR